MGGHVRGSYATSLMAIVVHTHAGARRAYHGARGDGNQFTHFVTLLLPRLVRVSVRGDFNTRLLKLESGKHSVKVHDGDDDGGDTDEGDDGGDGNRLPMMMTG